MRGLPYFSPAQHTQDAGRRAERVCQSPEEFKAWSQNFGHEQVLTIFLSYGSVSADRLRKIISGLSAPRKTTQPGADDIAETVFRKSLNAGAGIA
ncbi:MAG: hypothetical protein ACRD25_01155 [Terracidiphilus sp.]